MADPPTGTAAKHDPGGDTRTPRWVKVSGIIVLALVVIMLSVMFLGGHDPGRGGHGPGMGMSVSTH